jgi:hypothetical protein
MSEQEATAQTTNRQYIAMDDAAAELGVNRSTMYYYLKPLGIETKKFPLDRHTYIALTDLERIKEARRSAAEKRH